MNAFTQTLSRSKQPVDSLARGLGWFSLGLGLFELFAPQRLTRSLGMHGRERLLRAYGAREIVNGFGLLAATRRAPWMWARVVGDAVDIGTLLPYARQANARAGSARMALGAVIGVTVADIAGATRLAARTPRAIPARDYSNRSGFPRAPEAMRGIARREQVQPAPALSDALQPWTSG